jgi:hypothetical protein
MHQHIENTHFYILLSVYTINHPWCYNYEPILCCSLYKLTSHTYIIANPSIPRISIGGMNMLLNDSTIILVHFRKLYKSKKKKKKHEHKNHTHFNYLTTRFARWDIT